MYAKIRYAPLEIPAHVTEEAGDVVSAMLIRDPRRRLGSVSDVEEIKASEFFSDLDWDALFSKSVPPPFVPRVRGDADFSNFDEEFTEEPVKDSVGSALTPGTDAAMFEGFSYSSPSAMS